jgi:hypothetical protein
MHFFGGDYVAHASGERTTRLTNTSIPYLGVLIVGVTLSTYLQYLLQYLDYGIPVIKGQSPLVWGMGLTVLIALALWLPLPLNRARGFWPQAFLAVLGAGWLLRLILTYVHHDAFNYTTWLYPVILLMVWLKTPNIRETRAALLVLGWSGTALLVWTRVSELIGLIPMPSVSKELLTFEVQEYWLPLSGWLGPEGRWPGPLGGTAFTGMLAALLVVLAVGLRSKSSWVFGIVGVIGLLLTSSRGSFAATAAGVGLAIVFSNWNFLAKVSFPWRIAVAAIGSIATLGLLLKASPNLTGRTTFWPDFLHLWSTSPVTGVGATGYSQGTNWTQTAGSAHSFFIDELARNGLIGFIVLIATLVTAVALGLLAARRKQGGPIALITTVFVLGIANTPFSWLNPSILWLFLLIPALWAASISNQ